MCYRRRNQWLRLALALFCLPLIWLARVVYLTFVEVTVFGVGINIGCDDCNHDGQIGRTSRRTSPGSAIAMERGEASTVRMHALSNILARPFVVILVVIIVTMIGARARGRPLQWKRGEASTVRMHALSNMLARPCVGVLCFVCKAKLLLDEMCVLMLQKACAG